MLAILIIGLGSWGRYYPVVSHSFENGHQDWELVYAALEGWQVVPGDNNLKVVIPMKLTTNYVKTVDVNPATGAVLWVPTYGPCFQGGLNAIPWSWMNNANVEQVALVNHFEYCMTWLGCITPADLAYFRVTCGPPLDLRAHWNSCIVTASETSVYFPPSVVIPVNELMDNRTSLLPKNDAGRFIPVFCRDTDDGDVFQTNDGDHELWFQPLKTSNTSVPHQFPNRYADAVVGNIFPHVKTHCIQSQHVGWISLLLLGIYNLDVIMGKYDMVPGERRDLPVMYKTIATCLSMAAQMQQHAIGIVPSLVRYSPPPGEPHNDEAHTGSRQVLEDLRSLAMTDDLLDIIAATSGFPLGETNTRVALMRRRPYPRTMLAEDPPVLIQTYGDLTTMEWDNTVKPPVWRPYRAGTRWIYSTTSINFMMQNIPDYLTIPQHQDMIENQRIRLAYSTDATLGVTTTAGGQAVFRGRVWYRVST